jgi:hypothetical protein
MGNVLRAGLKNERASRVVATCLTTEGLFYHPQGFFSFTPSSHGNFGRPPYRTTHSNELEAVAPPTEPNSNLHARRACYNTQSAPIARRAKRE